MSTIIVTDTKGEKKTFPRCEIKANGEIWCAMSTPTAPLVILSHLGQAAAEIRQRYVSAMRAHEFAKLDPAHIARIGKFHGAGGVVLVEAEEQYLARTATARKEASAAEADKRANEITVYLSSRGWGDFSPVEWVGDRRLETETILSQCRVALSSSKDVDCDLTDEDIRGKIITEKEKSARKDAKRDQENNHEKEIFAKARESGERQALETWVTEKCMNGNDQECSFDRATRWALPDGTSKTTYGCCY